MTKLDLTFQDAAQVTAAMERLLDVTFKVHRSDDVRTYTLPLDFTTTLEKARQVLHTHHPGSIATSGENSQVAFLRGSRIVTAAEERETRLCDIVPKLFAGKPPPNPAFRYSNVRYREVDARSVSINYVCVHMCLVK